MVRDHCVLLLGTPFIARLFRSTDFSCVIHLEFAFGGGNVQETLSLEAQAQVTSGHDLPRSTQILIDLCLQIQSNVKA